MDNQHELSEEKFVRELSEKAVQQIKQIEERIQYLRPDSGPSPMPPGNQYFNNQHPNNRKVLEAQYKNQIATIKEQALNEAAKAVKGKPFETQKKAFRIANDLFNPQQKEEKLVLNNKTLTQNKADITRKGPTTLREKIAAMEQSFDNKQDGLMRTLATDKTKDSPSKTPPEQTKKDSLKTPPENTKDPNKPKRFNMSAAYPDINKEYDKSMAKEGSVKDKENSTDQSSAGKFNGATMSKRIDMKVAYREAYVEVDNSREKEKDGKTKDNEHDFER